MPQEASGHWSTPGRQYRRFWSLALLISQSLGPLSLPGGCQAPTECISAEGIGGQAGSLGELAGSLGHQLPPGWRTPGRPAVSRRPMPARVINTILCKWGNFSFFLFFLFGATPRGCSGLPPGLVLRDTFLVRFLVRGVPPTASTLPAVLSPGGKQISQSSREPCSLLSTTSEPPLNPNFLSSAESGVSAWNTQGSERSDWHRIRGTHQPILLLSGLGTRSSRTLLDGPVGPFSPS